MLSILFFILILVLLLIPFFGIDYLIIYLLNGNYDNLWYLFLFLILTYIVGYLLDNVLEMVVKVTLSKNKEDKMPLIFNLCVSFLTSLLGVYLLDMIFAAISLNTSIYLMVALAHTIIFFIIDQLPEGEN
ncbi:YrvL family regulatory protein [Listeria sp. PSOL-1]|uniref:YrvL family regulatory protein n=1 Tax=Listeria sp. PSOL-1 TaxID=1844999 RepID=UPI0013D08052|nr:YrvL family regulatory protein [Listeria sp. PSOL-1]